MDDCQELQTGGQVVGRVSPSTSLLIEALIQQLCAVFEGDAVRRNKLYYGKSQTQDSTLVLQYSDTERNFMFKAICDKLHEMKLIDASYNMEELDLVRSQYQKALFQLLDVARASTGSESALRLPR